MSEFGEKLKKIRLERKMNQIELAEKMGMKQASISQFENGQRLPTPANIKKLASILEVSVEYLAGKSDGKFERELLMRNIQGLSPETLRKINDIAEAFKKSEGK